ncbi:hypothetical protein EDD16DRAFT_1703818 [Pisolithus croceorrhizus]|nr:hypothetical protein EDD16DRAFT_1703818 [Pisolithus croceorrhizus]KAI6159938.1 hypothetical protein EDD17DRAFT_1761716 [Pisolithus thermaeus]
MSDSIPALTTLPMHLLNAQQNMVETGFYLGELGLHDRVKWVRDGHADCLVIAASAAKSDDMDSGKSPLSDDGAKEYPSPPLEDFEPAPLCAVVHISTCDFWLTADVGYCTSSIWKSFSDAKVTCTAERPEFEPFMDDYIMVSDNLRWLQESIETPGF